MPVRVLSPDTALIALSAIEIVDALALGIVPHITANGTEANINACLQSMAPARARAAKRKFRKLWRKELQKITKKLPAKQKRRIAAQFNTCRTNNDSPPPGWQRMNRRRLVGGMLIEAARAKIKSST